MKSSETGPEVKHQFLGPRVLLALVLAATPDATLVAQSRFFPDVPAFDLPVADPRASGFAARLVKASRGESQFGAEQEADVAIGERIPVLALRRGPRPLTLSFGVEVYSRFSLDDPRTALISADWNAGFDLHTTRESWEFAIQLYHESSHLGDEYADTFQATRLDWTRAALAGWVGFRPGNWRFMVGGTRVLRERLNLTPWLAAAGVDYRAPGFTLLGQRVTPVAGLFFGGASATDWRINSDAKLGLAISGETKGRELRLSFVRHDGLSTQRQFFRNESRYFGIEIEFQL